MDMFTFVFGRDNAHAFTWTTMSYLSGIGSASWNIQSCHSDIIFWLTD